MSSFIGALSLGILLRLYFFGETIIDIQLSKHIKHEANMIFLLGSFISITYLFNALALYKTSKVFEL